MTNTEIFQYITLITLLIGILNIIIPYITKEHSLSQLLTMLFVATLFFLCTLVLGNFYLHNGYNSFHLISFGQYKITFAIEPFTLIFTFLLSILWPFAVIYSHGYLSYLRNVYFRPQDNESKLIKALISSCILIAYCGALSENTFSMFIFYELLTIATIPLIYAGSITALGNYIRPLLYPSLLLFLPAMIVVSNWDLNSLPPYIQVLLLTAFVFGLSKTAIFPFSNWLTAAMVAIHPVSALLHAVAIVNTGIFMLAKIVWYYFVPILPQIFDLISEWVVTFAGITILYGAINAIMAKDLKYAIAYSTISQLSISLIGILMMSKTSIIAAICFIVAHSFTKITLFFLAGNIYLFEGTSKLSDLRGCYKKHPYSVFLFMISSLILMGLPFAACSISKNLLFEASKNYTNLLPYIMLFIGSTLTIIYQLRILLILYSRSDSQPDNTNMIEMPKHSFTSHSNSLAKALLMIPSITCILISFSFSFIAFAINKIMYFL